MLYLESKGYISKYKYTYLIPSSSTTFVKVMGLTLRK